MAHFKHLHGYPVQRCYAVLSASADYLRVMRWVEGQELSIEVHLNRTRFWIPEGQVLTEFLLRWSDSVMSCVEHDLIL
jgi:hypothetical protein